MYRKVFKSPTLKFFKIIMYFICLTQFIKKIVIQIMHFTIFTQKYVFFILCSILFFK